MRTLALLVFALGCNTTGIDAKPTARLWATEMGYKIQGVSCADSDSDWDGYVSCSVKPLDLDPISLQCGYGGRSGCKIIENIKMGTRR